MPDDIASNPNVSYKDKGWLNWGDWLGTGSIASGHREYRPFEEARHYVRRLNLKSYTEWRKFCKGQFPERGKLPADIPTAPDRVYQDKGWLNWGDWLGTLNIAFSLRKCRPFKKARAFIRG